MTGPIERAVEVSGSERTAPPIASVVDLFCGAGGLAHGFGAEGFAIAAGIDVDRTCRHPFETNNDAPFIERSVEELSGADIACEFAPNLPKVLIGCAPCQPFSGYRRGRDDSRWQLLHDFARLILETRPDVVSMENVPRLRDFDDGSVFDAFVRRLRGAGYKVDWTVANCAEFGVPQSRSRLVLLASLHGRPGVPDATTRGSERTVRDAIGHLRPLEAGEADPDDPLHRSAALSPRNRERMAASRPGGTWRDWDEDLVTPCHRVPTGSTYASVYGRMRWDAPAPTMTTQFYGFGNGRFGHPEQDRAISLREGAILQSFPEGYSFVPDDAPVHMSTLGRMIGNAVPVGLGRAVARHVAGHLREIGA